MLHKVKRMSQQVASKSTTPAAALFFAVLCLLAFPLSAEAQRAYETLREGMTRSEVLQLLGPPVEKQEFAAKWEDVWIYRYTKIRFREGKLLSVMDRDDVGSDVQWDTGRRWNKRRVKARHVNASETDQESSVNSKPDAESVAVEEILTEIMIGTQSSGSGKKKEEKKRRSNVVDPSRK